ncbi:DUF4255 domain-containing protein [Pseudomonas sp. BE134]|uniref:DUF4255 domain-containing protein n=1 Tax=Pseudomonas sp. BE134 TaxID=2817843 RepID=UPI0028592AF4|nr:DUF4255 domain-containing protein [Pseudomonas sp. BE134]MDR6929357.1 hypothetical protein [Pseudomonas sp. BE134]
MANFNAIAAVSRTLRRLLLDRMASAGVSVTLAPPDVTIAGVNGPRVNLYLYQVLEQAQLKNQSIPGHEHPAAFGHPPLSLTMRFLVSSYASSEDQQDSDIIAQSILGDAMLVLHDFGARMENMLLLTNRAGAIGDPVLDPVLQSEFERIKLVLHPIPFDEVSKLWSAMPEANLRRSVVYEASVVQIEGRLPHRQAQPVLRRRILASIARPPVLVDAYRTAPPTASSSRDARIGIGEEITIEHLPTTAERLYVCLGSLEPIRVALPSNGIIRILVPDAQYPIDLDHLAVRPIPPETQLQPGPLEIVLMSATVVSGVEGGLDRGTPVLTDRMLTSNSALMQLIPLVATASPTFGNAGAILRLTGQRLWADTLPSEVLMADVAVPVRPPQPGDQWAAPTSVQVEIPVSAIAGLLPPRATPYRVAAQTNGVRSRENALTFRLDP